MEKSENIFWKKPLIVCVFAIICCCLWGSAFPCIKLGYQWWGISSNDTGAQILFAGCRFTLSGIFTILIGSRLQKKFLRPKKENIIQILVLACFQTAVQYFFFYTGLANTTGVKASIITSANVFLAIILASIFMRQEKINGKIVTGCILGFLGVVLVNMRAGTTDLQINVRGDGAIFLSALSSAISSVFIKKFSQKTNPVMLSGYQFFCGGLVLIMCGFLAGGNLQAVSVRGIGILLYLAFLSAVAYTLWGILLKYNPVSKVSVFGFANPVAGVALSTIILHEKQEGGIIVFVALLLVSAGIYLVNHCPQEK